jgi:hypothetical protein
MTNKSWFQIKDLDFIHKYAGGAAAYSSKKLQINIKGNIIYWKHECSGTTLTEIITNIINYFLTVL